MACPSPRYLRAGAKEAAPSSLSSLGAQHEAAQALLKEVQSRLDADNFFLALAKQFAGAEHERVFTAPHPRPVTEFACFDAVNAAYQAHCGGYSDYAFQYARVVMNVCQHLGHTVRHAALLACLCCACLPRALSSKPMS